MTAANLRPARIRCDSLHAALDSLQPPTPANRATCNESLARRLPTGFGGPVLSRGRKPLLQIDLVKRADFDLLVGSIYATDRVGVPKGVVEVIL